MVVARERLLLLNPQAGSLSEDDEAKLRELLSEYEVVRLAEGEDLGEALARQELAADAVIAVVGGDGTVAAAARALAGTDRRLAIIPLGTFNNFARALGIPLEAEAAAHALRTGRPAAVTLGRVGERVFLEVASLGLFGDLINLGEAAKELQYGELLERMRELSAPSFEYRLSGDVQLAGRARGLLLANTPSTGALVPVGSVTPEQPYLELSILSAGRRTEVLRRLGARALPFLRRAAPGRRVRRVRIETDPPINVYADATQVGQTPAEIRVDLEALKVVLPA